MVLGQRLSEWCGNAPFLEEDLAIANVALDYIGRADLFYRYASELDGSQRSADEIAFLRDSREYRNLLICELPAGDFACTMARQVLFDSFNRPYLERLAKSSDLRIARDCLQGGQGKLLSPCAQPRMGSSPGRRYRGEPREDPAGIRRLVGLHPGNVSDERR